MDNTYKNLNNFEAWLKANVKQYHGNLEVYLEDLKSQHCSSGSTSYELEPFVTKSGNPETYDYTAIYHYFDDGKEFFSHNHDNFEEIDAEMMDKLETLESEISIEFIF